MKIIRTLLTVAAFGLLPVGCGNQHKAESVVSDFIEANTVNDGYEVMCAPLDSTDRIPADRMAAMRSAASTDSLFKRGVSLAPLSKNDKYAYTRTKIISGTDTLVRTFYLDMELTHIVAFKQN